MANSTAKVTQAFATYAATGNREDLSNAIYNIDPFDTPVMSAARRRNVKNRWFDWQTEFLPTVNLTNAQPEGFNLNTFQDRGDPNHPSAGRGADLQARCDRVGLAGRGRRGGQGLRDGAPDGDHLQGAQVRHGIDHVLAPGAGG